MTVPTLTSRKLVRQRLATLLDEITTLVTVYDHETKDFERKSPIATIHSDGTLTTFPDYTREFHRFWISAYWRREDDDITEDYVDDLAAAIRQKLIDNLEETGYWHDIHFDEEFSEMDYVIIDGVMYRRERWRVTIFVVEADSETAPTAPSGLVATEDGSTAIDLVWNDNSDNELQFVIERSLTGVGGWEIVATPAADSESYTDTGLDPATTYYYRIKAENNIGSSAYSAVDSATTDWSPIGTPTLDFIASPTYLFQANNGTNPVTAFGQTVLSWKDRIANELLVASTGAKYQSENTYDAVEFLDANERYTATLDIPAGARTYQMVVSSALAFGSGNPILFYHASSLSQIAGSFKWGGDDSPQFFLSSTLHKSWNNNPETLDGEIHIVTLTLPSADLAGLQAATLHIDGVERTDTEIVTTGSTAAWTGFSIGGGTNDYFGHVYRFLVYEEALSEADREFNEAGLADLYGVIL